MLAKTIFTSTLTIFWFSLTIAQSLIVEEGQILSITSEATLTLSQSMENDGFVINQGIIHLGQNWINRSSYSGNGSVELIGLGQQLIQHDGQTFGTLRLENDGDKVLESSISVRDTLILNSGILVASQSNILQLEETALVNNASETSYVRGPIQFAGTGYRYLPLGTENAFLPLELQDVRGVTPVLLAEVVDSESLQVRGDRLEEKGGGKYWTFNVVSGTYEGSIVTLPVTEEDNFDDLVGVVVVQADDLTSDFTSLGQEDRSGSAVDGLVTSELAATGPIVSLGLTTEYSLENSVEIPSAFAPDAANPTDREIKVYAANLLADGFSFTVFNRWGQIVYQTRVLNDALTVGWNGVDQNSNEPAPSGVYSYILRGRFETNQAVEKTGSITLFR